MKEQLVIWIEKKALDYKIAVGINTTTIEPSDKSEMIALYTNPANEKVKETTDLYEKVCNCKKKLELTDEGMYELLEKYQGIELCKAVLKKAQEK